MNFSFSEYAKIDVVCPRPNWKLTAFTRPPSWFQLSSGRFAQEGNGGEEHGRAGIGEKGSNGKGSGKWEVGGNSALVVGGDRDTDNTGSTTSFNPLLCMFADSNLQLLFNPIWRCASRSLRQPGLCTAELMTTTQQLPTTIPSRPT